MSSDDSTVTSVTFSSGNSAFCVSILPKLGLGWVGAVTTASSFKRKVRLRFIPWIASSDCWIGGIGVSHGVLSLPI